MTTQLNKSSFINEPDLNSKIIITGASPDRINRNTILRKFVLEGFIAAIGLKNVYECPLEIVSEMAIKKKPKLIIFFGSCMPDQSNYFEIRKVADKLKIDLAFWVHDDPYEFDYSYKLDTIADYIFSNDKWSSMHYSHPKIFHLPLAGSASHHFRPWKNKKNMIYFFVE
jgi:spore maturation protein CgeB